MTDTPALQPLFPEIEPFATHMLDVGDGHTLYVEQSGNPQGIPVVVLHGGPGSGCNEKSRRRFDPARYHIICFDQRGAGRSTPAGKLEANTTAHLITDLERIRTLVRAEGWVVYGTSWGSTLALAYAQAHPDRTRGILIGGIFTGTTHELNWLKDPAGLPRFRSAEYLAVLSLLPQGTPLADMEKALLKLITEGTPDIARTAAETFGMYESSACFPDYIPADMRAYFAEDPHFLSHIAIELHYFANNCFLEPEQLLRNAYKLDGIPTTILQGAIDFICPPATAHALHAALPESELLLLPTSNHVANDAMESARINATNAMATRLGA